MGTISLNCDKQAGKRLLLNLFLVHIQLQKKTKNKNKETRSTIYTNYNGTEHISSSCSAYLLLCLVTNITYNLIYQSIKQVITAWRDRVRRLATDPVVMRSSPATGHIRCALLVNQPK